LFLQYQSPLFDGIYGIAFLRDFISINDSDDWIPSILPIFSETILCIWSNDFEYIVTSMSNLPVTSAISLTSSIPNNFSITLSRCFVSMLIPVNALTWYPSSASLTSIVKRSINFLLTNLLILEYTTEEFTSIFFDNRGTEIDASLDNSDKISKSRLSTFTV